MRLADTNVLVYAVSNREADAPKRLRAETTLKEPDLALSVQGHPGVLLPGHQAPGTGGIDPRAGHGVPAAAEVTLPIQEITVELFDRATEIRGRFGLSYWDAAILAAAKMLGCEAVYSEDMSHEEDYDGLRVINPFSEGG